MKWYVFSVRQMALATLQYGADNENLAPPSPGIGNSAENDFVISAQAGIHDCRVLKVPYGTMDPGVGRGDTLPQQERVLCQR